MIRPPRREPARDTTPSHEGTMTPIRLAALAALAIPLLMSTGCGGGALSPGRISYEQTAPDQWAVGIEGARAAPAEGVAVEVGKLRVERSGESYAAAVGVGVLTDDVSVDTSATLDLTDIGGDASLSASVDPTEGRSVAIDTTASWASPVADVLDGGLMSLGTCAAIGTADAPTELCVRYEAGTMGGQDTACVSYGAGVNLCFPLPDAWRGGGGAGEQGAADEPATEGAPADGGYPEPSEPLIEATALDAVTPTYPSRAPALPRTIADAGDAG